MTPEQQRQIALCQGDWNDLPGRTAEFRIAALLKKYPAAAVKIVAERSEPRQVEGQT